MLGFIIGAIFGGAAGGAVSGGGGVIACVCGIIVGAVFGGIIGLGVSNQYDEEERHKKEVEKLLNDIKNKNEE